MPNDTAQPTFTIFILLQACEAWLRLQRHQRRALADAHISLPLASAPALHMRYFDAEAFCAQCSDIMTIETADLTGYYDFIEQLRDSPIFTEPYFRLVQIIPTIENGYKGHEDRHR